MDEIYWAARLKALETRLEEHVLSARGDLTGGTDEYRRGYRRGSETATVRALAMVRQVRRDLSTDAARAAR